MFLVQLLGFCGPPFYEAGGEAAIEQNNQSAGRYLTALLVTAAAMIHVGLVYIKGALVSHCVSRESAQSQLYGAVEAN